jgi:hypothetical protein
MRKTIATVIILGLLWIGYTAWPLYDLLVLVRAMEIRDVDTVTRHVYFDAVRVSLTNQVVAAYVRRTRINISPLAQSMAAGALGIANPIVSKLISPEALSELLGIGWPVTVGSDPPPGTVGITRSTIGTIWQIFENSEYGFARFEVAAPSVLPQQQRFRLAFRLLQWRWRLVAITPANASAKPVTVGGNDQKAPHLSAPHRRRQGHDAGGPKAPPQVHAGGRAHRPYLG